MVLPLIYFRHIKQDAVKTKVEWSGNYLEFNLQSPREYILKFTDEIRARATSPHFAYTGSVFSDCTNHRDWM